MSVADRTLPHVIGCEMVNFSAIVVTDHREFLIDIDINTYFNVTISEFNEILKIKLNPNRLSHKTKFTIKAEEIIATLKLDKILKRICEDGLINEKIEYADK